MRGQSRKRSLVEVVTSTLTGLIISFGVQLIIYPLLDIPVKFSQNIIITIVFFTVSILRGYVIRRFFNRSSVNE